MWKEKLTNPFQLQVGIAGKKSVLPDVGYGVSQVLPVIVEVITNRDADFILLQQPEVHLHPKAQAALGTMFANLTSSSLVRNLIVETHSDYVIDRVRLAIAEGTVKPDNVALLYLEKTGRMTRVHQICFDNNGSVIDPPPTYREFFMREELRLLDTDADEDNH